MELKVEKGYFCLGGGSNKPTLRDDFQQEARVGNNKQMEFSVKSAYGFLRGEGCKEDSRRYKFFWRIKALPSTHVTGWRVIENKVACMVNLERRGIGSRAIFVVCAQC